MSTLPIVGVPPRSVAARVRMTFADGWVLVWRILTHLRHSPGQVVTLMVFPAIMVVLFGYVLGSSIVVPGDGNYREYLMPGLFVMTAFSGVMLVAGRVVADAERGVMDRFRSMPITRSTMMFGQTGADIIIGIGSTIVMVGCGYAVGWRFHHGIANAAVGFGLLIIMRYGISWLGVCLGLGVPDEATASNMVPLIFPVTMISNTFVPTSSMPSWLRVIAEWNPVSALVSALRAQFGNPTNVTTDQIWPLAHPVAASLIWAVVLIVVFVPGAGWMYRTWSATR